MDAAVARSANLVAARGDGGETAANTRGRDDRSGDYFVAIVCKRGAGAGEYRAHHGYANPIGDHGQPRRTGDVHRRDDEYEQHVIDAHAGLHAANTDEYDLR